MSSSSDIKTPSADAGSVSSLLVSDVKLAEKKDHFAPLYTKYNALPSDAVIERTRTALAERKFIVQVVNTKAEALKAALAYFPATASTTPTTFSVGGSQTLTEIGFTEWAKDQTAHTNYKSLQMANWGKPAFQEYTLKGLTAEKFFTSASAVTEDGRLVWASGSGTRVTLLAGQTVFVVGANKIVPTLEAGLKRLDDYCVPVNGAMVRAKFGLPDTYNMETGILNGQSPFNPNQFVVILVKESLGY